LRGVWVQRLAEFAEQLAQGVALKIGLDMLAIAVLDQMSGEVVAVGLCSAIKAFFFDQAFVAVVDEGVTVAVFVDQSWVRFTHYFHPIITYKIRCHQSCLVVVANVSAAVNPAMLGKNNSRKGKKQNLTACSCYAVK